MKEDYRYMGYVTCCASEEKQMNCLYYEPFDSSDMSEGEMQRRRDNDQICKYKGVDRECRLDEYVE